MGGIMDDLWTVVQFLVPPGKERLMVAAATMESSSGVLYALTVMAIGAWLVSALYVAILFSFRFSVHEVEGPVLSALWTDFSTLGLLFGIWVFATNAISYLLRTSATEDIGFWIRGAYMFLYGHILFASLRHMYEIYVAHVRGIKYDQRDLQGKVYIVTGSNQGCGYETTMAMVRMSATVGAGKESKAASRKTIL